MDSAQIVHCGWWTLLLLGGCAAMRLGAAGPGGPGGTAGISPGLHRRLDGVGFADPQNDEFFADYKDLVSPPKDLLDTAKTVNYLVETPEDLVETPKDLTDTPKDLLDDHRNEDFEEYAQNGSAEKKDVEDEGEGDRDEDTQAHHDLADLSLAKHFKDSDRTRDGSAEAEAVADEVADEVADAHQDSGEKTSLYGQQQSTQAPFEQVNLRSPYELADFGSPYKPVTPIRKPTKAAPISTGGYHGHSSPFRNGLRTNLEYNQHVGRLVRPEYAYRYGVHDPTTRDVKSVWEQRDGEDTRGGYTLLEPNGHTRVVEYQVTKQGGFNARVKHLPPGIHGR